MYVINSYGEYNQNPDDNDPVEGTEIVIDEIGEYYVEYWSEDNASNREYSKYVSVEIVEDYIPRLLNPVGNILLKNWNSSPQFEWVEKLTTYPYYGRDGEEEITVSDYIYELKVFEVGGSTDTIIHETDISGSSWLASNPADFFEEGKTYNWMVRSKYQYEWKAGDWSENWSTKIFTIVDRQITAIIFNDNDTITLMWNPFLDGTVYKIESCVDPVALEWITVDPVDQFPLHATKWTGGSWKGDDEKYYRVVGIIPDIDSVIPSSGQKGSISLAVDIFGNFTEWQAGTTAVSFGTGITVDSLNVETQTHVSVTITIDVEAQAGLRDVVVTSGSNVYTEEEAFEVVE